MPDGTREKINFYVYYDMDEAEVKTLLRVEWYDGDEETRRVRGCFSNRGGVGCQAGGGGGVQGVWDWGSREPDTVS